MNALTNFIAAIRRDNEGQDLLEYALLVALIAIVAVAAITTAGEAVVTQIEAIASALSSHRPADAGPGDRPCLRPGCSGGNEMNTLLGRITRSLKDAEGQDLLEYSMLVALITVVAVGAITAVGTTINTVFWQAIAASNI